MRKHRLAELDPRRTTGGGISFECPEADGGCQGRHAIPGDRWAVVGGDVGAVTVTPSIRCWGACRIHITITAGQIIFCEDSRSGPDPKAFDS